VLDAGSALEDLDLVPALLIHARILAAYP
jgi:hypothetical protein